MNTVSQSKQDRLIQMGMRTITGQAREGFFIPYRYASAVPERVGRYDTLAAPFEGAKERFGHVLSAIEQFRADLIKIDGSGTEQARWDQYWYPRLDAASAYAMVRSWKPERIIEVGSGHSIRFMARAVADGDLTCAMTAIDPEPRTTISNLPVSIERRVLQDVDLSLFTQIEPGDFVCIDSSHILMPGTDVDIALNRILPALPSGAIVAFHDVFLPYPYPPDWDWRNYNEQIGVGALLQGGYELVFASHYVLHEMADVWEDTVIADLPLLDGAHECGIWLRKS